MKTIPENLKEFMSTLTDWEANKVISWLIATGIKSVTIEHVTGLGVSNGKCFKTAT